MKEDETDETPEKRRKVESLARYARSRGSGRVKYPQGHGEVHFTSAFAAGYDAFRLRSAMPGPKPQFFQCLLAGNVLLEL